VPFAADHLFSPILNKSTTGSERWF
jgi:hypothetical protein